MRQATGASNPIASFKSVVLPEPLGPIRTVGGPVAIESVTLRRIDTPPAVYATSSKQIGRVVARSRMRLSRMTLGPAPHGPGQSVDRQDHSDQDDTKTDGERKVALRRLKRNR